MRWSLRCSNTGRHPANSVRVRPFDIKAGKAAMYFPGANIMVPGTIDPDSKTPASKSVPITLEPELA